MSTTDRQEKKVTLIQWHQLRNAQQSDAWSRRLDDALARGFDLFAAIDEANTGKRVAA